MFLAALLLAAMQAQSDETAPDPTAPGLTTCAPETFDAAIACLDQHLPAQTKATLRRDGAIEAHFGLGMWLRNNWGLWRGGALAVDMRRLGFAHPDDMSATILDGFVARLRDQPFDLTRRAAEYRSYWQQAEATTALFDEACRTRTRVPAGRGLVAVCTEENGMNFMRFETQEGN